MNVFAIFGVEETELMKKFIDENFSTNYASIGVDEWFVASNKTTNELTDFFLSQEGDEVSSPLGTFIIIPVTNWNGWYVKDTWEWLEAKSKEIAVEG